MSPKEELRKSRLLRNGVKGVAENKKYVSDNAHLMAEWDWERNAQYEPNKISFASHTKVWWKCSKGHSWDAAVAKRSLGQGCPFCAGARVLKGYNDLNTTHPELVKQWDDEKNEKRADEFSAKSNKKAWWKCSRGHSWEAAIAKRVLGQRCPYCVGKTVLAGFNDLGTTHPHLVQEWDYDKNLDIMPTSVSKGSTVKVWWKCKRNHSWSSAIYSRIAGVGCPHCAKELQSSFPEKAIYFYVKKAFCDTVANYKSELLNMFELDIFIPSLMVGIEYDGERWHQEIEGDLEKNRLCSELGITLIRVREPRCPVLMDSRSLCIIRKSKRSGLDEVISKVLLEVCRKANVECSIEVDLKKDYAAIFELLDPQEKEDNICLKYPSLEKEWDYEKNEALRPDMLTSGSDKRVWWICDQGHSYQATVSARARGRGCSICAGKQILKGFNDLESKCPTIAKDWDYQRNPISPDAVAYGSDKVYWWKCELGHSYDCSVNNRRAGQTCPFCSGKRVLVGVNDLATTHPEIARQWCNELNETHPTEVSKGSHKRVWWECEKCGYRWLSAVYNRCGNGSNCPRCSGWKGRKK